MPFVDDLHGKYGGDAADRFAEELTRRANEFRPAIEVASPEQVKRSLETLQLTAPVTDSTSFLRVGRDLKAESLIRGHILNYRIVDVPGGKQAQVIYRVEVVNVASNEPINGAANTATSTVRSGATDDELYNDAFTQAAADAVASVLSHTLPTATVLNTSQNGNFQEALVNKGARAGLQDGMTVLVNRGREQVATARIHDVEPDLASVTVIKSVKGIEPGDTVTVAFDVPTIAANFSGPTGDKASYIGAKHHGPSGNLVSLLLIVALGIFLLGNGHSGSTGTLAGVTAEPTLYPEIGGGTNAVQNSAGTAAVRIQWRTDAFAGGNFERLAFQVYRDDYPASAVQVAFSGTVAYDTSTNRDASFEWYNLNHVTVNNGISQAYQGGCLTIGPAAPATPPPGVTPGRAYQYSVSEVFQVPSTYFLTQATTGTGTSTAGGTATGGTSTSTSTSTGTTGGTTGTTGGTTAGSTATGTTGTTGTTGGSTSTATGGTGTGTATGAEECTFETTPTPASGIATPLSTVLLAAPAEQATLTGATPFSFTSVENGAYPQEFQYVLQFSTEPQFHKQDTYTWASFQSIATGPLSTPTVDPASSSLPSNIRLAQLVYWRIGARAVNDSPGPVMDTSGQRYIFSAPRAFKRVGAGNPGNP